jgi:feruloyl-CoA synthase
MPVLAEEPPVLVDWLPWNHTFGGNHNFGMTVYNGGTLYIDDGKPTPALMGETLRNLREIAPTVYFNVPTGFEAIANAMKTDAALRATCCRACAMFFYAGAALAQPVWDSLHARRGARDRRTHRHGHRPGHDRIRRHSHLRHQPQREGGPPGRAGAGLELKLVPTDGKTEVRYKGPNITPGYWRAPEATAEAFDDEGFFCTGDAVQVDRRERHPPGPEVRRPHRRGLQARHRHLRQRGPAAREDHRRRRALCAGRGAHRPEPEGSRRAAVPTAGGAQLAGCRR